jgi:Family of unknown function (DUF5330)
MMFLLRTTFWMSVVLALLPSFVSGQATAPEVGTSEAVTAASATFADLSRFCERRPDACAAGAQFAVAFGQRAQAGAKIVYDFATDRFAKQEHGKQEQTKSEQAKSEQTKSEQTKSEQTKSEQTKPEHLAAGNPVASAAEAPAVEPAKVSQHTLTAADMAPSWRGVPARRETKRPS